jgi:hypothetical protein
MPHAVKPVRGRYGKPWHDGKARDGGVANGWRRIRKGGYIRFNRVKYAHESFTNWIGLWVFVVAADYWGFDVHVYPDTPWNSQELMCVPMSWAR